MEHENESLHDTEVEEELSEDVEVESEDSESPEEITITKSELTKLKRKALAYEAGKKEKVADVKEKQTVPQNTNAGLTREEAMLITRQEAMLIAKGYDEEDLDNLNIIARGKAIDLKTAQSDPLFVSYMEQKQKEIKSEKAKLSASRSSGISQGQTLVTPGMSEEDHKALVYKLLGK